MGTDVEKWLKEEGEKVLEEVGAKKAHIILDFGCGAGTYSLPAAKIVGKKGQVFALDKSKSKLRTRKPSLRSVFKNKVLIAISEDEGIFKSCLKADEA